MPTTAPAVAKDAAFAYFGIPISDNIARRPDTGYVICKDAVLGRTGKMQYQVSSLKRAQLQDLGIADKYQPHDVVDIWRDSDEVFSPATLTSFEGMPLTDDHPQDFVTADNHRDHSRGHVQNIRQGTTPLSSGDYPILGDVIITDRALGNQVLSRRKRELSCGYNYHLAYDGQRLSQVGITGNHVAVVARGRAGAEARINDAAPPRKEYPVMFKDLLIGLGLKQMATDNADPEKIVAAARGAFALDATDAPAKDAKEEGAKQAIAALDAEIAALKAENEKLKAKDAKPADKAEDKSLADQLAALDEDKEDDEDEDEDGKKKKDKAEDADFIEPFGEEGDLRSQLRALRPLVARSNDAKLRAKFNKLCAKANDGLKGTTPDDAYSRALQASGTVSSEAKDSAAASEYVARLNARAKAHGEEVK